MDLFRYNKALEFANKQHKGQTFEVMTDIPYISHPYFVAGLLERFGFSEDVIIAGLLHDVIEDTGCEPVKMEKEFGKNVTRIVQEVTFDQSIPWREKQGVMQKRMAGASPEAKAVKIADIIRHLISLIGFVDDEKGPELIIRRGKHSVEEYVWKYGELIKAISQNWEHPILKEAQELLETFKNKTKPDE